MSSSPTAPLASFASIDNTPSTESASPNRLGVSMAVTAIPSAPVLNASQQHQLDKLKKSKVELSFSEGTKARALFMSQTNEYLTSKFQLRTVLSEMGLYPSDKELGEVFAVLNNKLDFASFTKYLTFLKVKYMRPEPKDLDTVRAFAALGGSIDRQGNISVELLRENCKKFSLTIDIDAMINEVDEDASGLVDFQEFKSMWEVKERVNGGGAFADDKTSPNGTAQKQRGSGDMNGSNSGANALELLQNGGDGDGAAVDDTFADEMMELLDRSDDGDDFGTLDDQMRRLRERHSPTKSSPRGEAEEVSNRQLIRKQSAILRPDGEGDEREMLAILHHYLRLPDRNTYNRDTKAASVIGGGHRQSMRRMSQRKSLYGRLPSIGRTNSVLVNSAAAAASTTFDEGVNVVSDDEGLEGSLQISTSPNAASRRGRGVNTRGTQKQPTITANTTGGYRAPSPVILSQYNATKGRADAKLSPAKGPRPPPRSPRGTIYNRR